MFDPKKYAHNYYLTNKQKFTEHGKKYYLKNRAKFLEYEKRDDGLHHRFAGIKTRCTNKKDKNYKYYGEKGIKCLWSSYQEFKNDMYESYLMHIKEHGRKQTTIDRINSNGNYCKENCRWATNYQQQNNSSNNKLVTYKGETLPIIQWSKRMGISDKNLYYRINKGWSAERALETKVKSRIPNVSS